MLVAGQEWGKTVAQEVLAEIQGKIRRPVSQAVTTALMTVAAA